MATSAAQIRAYTGPALFTYGFRPFFLFGAAWAALSVLLWLPMLSGHIALPTHLAPHAWHSHEMIFGYVPAVIAGFLLTAVPNWTGRLPVIGPRLAALAALWAAGRLAMLTSAWLGSMAAALVDVSFLLALAAVVAREVVAGRSFHNLKVVGGLAALTCGNVLFHLEAMGLLGGGYGVRLGIATAVFMVMLIGGRIVPSFTRNWLARQPGTRLPVPFNALDAVVMVGSGLVLALWVALPDSVITGWLALLAGVANFGRMARWAGDRTRAEPMVAILHVGFAFVPIGFLLVAASILAPHVVAPSGALHGWTAGCFGVMTLAVMTRASLGHTGRPLTATPAISAIYACAILSALARIVAAFGVWRMPLLELATVAWVLAFAGFVWVYAPLLAFRRS